MAACPRSQSQRGQASRCDKPGITPIFGEGWTRRLSLKTRCGERWDSALAVHESLHPIALYLYEVMWEPTFSTFSGAAHLLVCVWTVTRAFPGMIWSPILSPPWFPVLPRLVISPSSIGGGAIRRGLDITSCNCAQDAQAQDDQQKTCHHVQAPSMTSMGVEAGRDARRHDLRLCLP